MTEETLVQQNINPTPPTVANSQPAAFITEPKQLADQKVYEEFKDIVDEIILNNNREQAIKARILLQDILLPKYPELANDAPVLFVKYQQLIVLLNFLTLSARPQQEIEQLIQIHLIDAIKAKLPVHTIFQDVLDTHNDIALEGEMAEFLARAMLTSETRIGAGLMTIDNKTLPGSIKNWLNDYNARTHQASANLNSRGAVERISYVNQSQSARNLNEGDRKLLLIILEIYDWLRYGTGYEEAVTDISAMVSSTPSAPPTPPAAPIPHGASLEEFKAKMEQRPQQIVSPPLGEMSAVVQTKADREGVLARIKTPSPPAPLPQAGEGGPNLKKINLTPDEIKREATTTELPGYKPAAFGVAAKSPVPPAVPMAPRPMAAPDTFHQREGISLSSVQTIDDFKKLDLTYLRRGNLESQTQNLKSQILRLAQVNRVLPYYVVSAFEQSPLFKSYMAHGNSKVIGSGVAGDMTQAEFEAMADLRKEIERL